MIKLLNLLSPRTLMLEIEEKELPEEFKVFDRGLEFLKQRVDALNKKAAKYHVPLMDIEILKEEMVKVLRPEIKKQIAAGTLKFGPGVLDSPEGEGYWTYVKQYTVSIDGEPPHIEGYEFIARLEHIDGGNFIYVNPKGSVQNLPAEYKTMNQHCDVCHTNRDRNDTFVIRMEQEDPKRFPGKKQGDLLVVGRNCLSRFLPGGSIAGLIAWTKMIDNLKDDISAAGEMTDGVGGYGSSGTHYEESDHLLAYIIGTYLHTGTYVSGKKAQQNYEENPNGPNTTSTLSRARSEMYPTLQGVKNPEQTFPIWWKLHHNEEFKQKVESSANEFKDWLSKVDWAKRKADRPQNATFFDNLELVSQQEYLRGNHFGFFSALFQLYLRDKWDAEKKADDAKALAAKPPSPVKFEMTMVGRRLRDIAKETEVKNLISQGKDEKTIKKLLRGKEWGWPVFVKKLTEYEKTQTFSHYDSGIGYRILFEDEWGNQFMWFASTTLGMNENGKYIIDGTITTIEPPSKYHPNREQVRINRVKIIKDLQDAAQAVTPAEPTVPPQNPNLDHPPVV